MKYNYHAQTIFSCKRYGQRSRSLFIRCLSLIRKFTHSKWCNLFHNLYSKIIIVTSFTRKVTEKWTQRNLSQENSHFSLNSQSLFLLSRKRKNCHHFIQFINVWLYVCFVLVCENILLVNKFCSLDKWMKLHATNQEKKVDERTYRIQSKFENEPKTERKKN